MDISQYLEIFIDESKEHLQLLNQSLLVLENNPDDTAVINEIFRAAHTLKGMAGTMGFSKMATLTHDMEDVLQTIRTGEIKVTPPLVDLLFTCLDALETYVNNVVDSGNEGDNECSSIISSLKNVIVSKGVVSTPSKDTPVKQSVQSGQEFNEYDKNIIDAAREQGLNALKIKIVFNKGCLLKAARAFIVFQKLEKIAEVTKSIPKVEDIEDEKFDQEIILYIITSETKESIQKELDSVSEVDSVEVTDADLNSLNENYGVQQAMSEIAATVEAVKAVASVDKSTAQENKTQNNNIKPKTGKTVRVDIDRLDVLMNLVSELIIIKTRLDGIKSEEKDAKYSEAVEYLERITTSLHDAVMKVRMVPVETVFNRFPRMIRDVSRDLGKEINLVMSGEETELDRTVIDEIGDPLIHLLRNSADHGIEPHEKRMETGKSEIGHIYLRAYQDGNSVVIEVEDDGQGLNVEKIKKKAIEKGLVTTESVKTISEKELLSFMFQPSFSTADKVTDLSGRGVGLDVVKTKIETLGGNVEVETQVGIGTKFTIRLPLTLAIIQALLVGIGKEKYAVPLSSVKQIIDVTREEIKIVQKKEVILLRNSVIPIIRLNELFNIESTNANAKSNTVVIVNKGEKLYGIMVDELFGQQEIVIKSLGKLLSGIRLFAGATILGDGNVALILDINSIVK